MQNIIEAAREYGFFVHREDVASFDWTIADYAAANTWYDFDCSAIVPVNAHAILLRVEFQVGFVAYNVHFQRKGYTNNIIKGRMISIASGVPISKDMVIGIDSDRTFRSKVNPAKPQVLNVVIKGWWY